MSLESGPCSCESCEVAIKDDARGKKSEYKNIMDFIKDNKKLITIILGISFFASALIFDFPFPLYFSLLLVSYILAGGEVIYKAIRNITKGEIFDENFLMSVATLGAFAIGEYPEGAAVMLFYQVGVLFEGAAVSRSRRSIESLMSIRPDYANLLKDDGSYHRVFPGEVHPSDVIMVKPGEKIPLDGKIITGKSTADTSILTGESLPRELNEGDEVLSGYININGLLKIKVTKEFEQSTVSKILELVKNAANKKAPTEKFITKFARVYTPVVVAGAVIIALVPPLFLADATFSQWIYRALVFLVISCPCALVVSIPMGFMGGIGKASRSGILVKGSNYLEALNDIDTVIFDKTGTITQGIFEVTEVSPAYGFDKEELLNFAVVAEGISSHPIAEAIRKASYNKERNPANSNDYENYEEIPGMGVSVNYNGKIILAGNKKLLEEEGISLEKVKDENKEGTTVYLAVDGQFAGYISVSDKLKEGSYAAVRSLREKGVKEMAILTGDIEEAAKGFGRKLGIDKVYAHLLPGDKLDKLESIYEEKKKNFLHGNLLYVGDGINDAPVIARADVGVAMGGLGTDVAIESADVVLMTDEPDKLVEAINIAGETRKKVWQNIFFALGVKGSVLLLGALGLATMWQAVIADVGVTILAAANSLKLSL